MPADASFPPTPAPAGVNAVSPELAPAPPAPPEPPEPTCPEQATVRPRSSQMDSSLEKQRRGEQSFDWQTGETGISTSRCRKVDDDLLLHSAALAGFDLYALPRKLRAGA